MDLEQKHKQSLSKGVSSPYVARRRATAFMKWSSRYPRLGRGHSLGVELLACVHKVLGSVHTICVYDRSLVGNGKDLRPWGTPASRRELVYQ